jgi:hemoglobin/transferrin/lactoferrin receptor protein
MRLRWTPAETVWIEGLLTVADEQDRLSSGDQGDTTRIPPGGTPGYTVWTLRGGFRPLEHLDVTLAVENLTDVDYRLHGSGINEPGTSAVLGLRYTF